MNSTSNYLDVGLNKLEVFETLLFLSFTVMPYDEIIPSKMPLV